MAIVIPDELEDAFRDEVRRAMGIYRFNENGADYEECSFCGEHAECNNYREMTFDDMKHTNDCLGVRLLALESVEVEEHIQIE
jgi:hypothetical protein